MPPKITSENFWKSYPSSHASHRSLGFLHGSPCFLGNSNDARFTNSPRYTPLTPSPWPSRRRSRLAKVSQENAKEATSIRMSWPMSFLSNVLSWNYKSLWELIFVKLTTSSRKNKNLSVSKFSKLQFIPTALCIFSSDLKGKALGSTNLHRRSVVSKSKSQSCAPMTHTCLGFLKHLRKHVILVCAKETSFLKLVHHAEFEVCKPEPPNFKKLNMNWKVFCWSFWWFCLLKLFEYPVATTF